MCKFYPKILEHIRPGALFNFESEYGDQENPIYSYTKSRSQSRTPFCTAAQNYKIVLISISPKDVGFLWYYQMLERFIGNYQLKLPYILNRGTKPNSLLDTEETGLHGNKDVCQKAILCFTNLYSSSHFRPFIIISSQFECDFLLI